MTDLLDDDPAAVFGRCLRTARLAADLTAVDVAGILGCSQAAVSRWETGDRTPTLHDLPAIARAVGTSVADLLGFNASEAAYDAAFRDGWRACVEAMTAATAVPIRPTEEIS